MLIFLDNNILCADFHMNGPSFEIMKKLAQLYSDKLLSMKFVTSIEKKQKNSLKRHKKR